tara:strand:+ start:1805 stop:2104 length:300 start_codon:yes stop_codon:yes gene_type:complete
MAYKARSITSKASSACKMNMGLVLGAADVAGSKKFKDHGEGMAENFSGGGGGSSAPAVDEEKNSNDADAAAAAKAAEADKNKGQADNAVSTDTAEAPKV